MAEPGSGDGSKAGPQATAIRRPNDQRPRRSAAAGDASEPHVRELAALGELMLGAAYADGVKAAVEIIAIAEQLKEFVAAAALPRHVQHRLEAFDPAAFDPADAVAQLVLKDDRDREAVLTLIARVTHSDRHLHPKEDLYLRQVAGLLGLDPDTIEITIT